MGKVFIFYFLFFYGSEQIQTKEMGGSDISVLNGSSKNQENVDQTYFKILCRC
jgi:hypothetical protein